MFGIFSGVLANAGLVILGSILGKLLKGEKFKRVGERIFQAFAIYVLVMGVTGVAKCDKDFFMLVSIMLGVAIGELVDIDAKFHRLGEFFQEKFSKGDDGFADGFVSASLLFCIGAMTIMGGLQSGIQNEHSIYYTKGILDMISAMTMTMGKGIGVAFSSICILVYQGLLTIMASALQPILTPEIITASVAVGSLCLVAIGLNMLGITKLKVANFVPAMFIPIIWQAILVIFA